MSRIEIREIGLMHTKDMGLPPPLEGRKKSAAKELKRTPLIEVEVSRVSPTRWCGHTSIRKSLGAGHPSASIIVITLRKNLPSASPRPANAQVVSRGGAPTLRQIVGWS